jgi:hypothetical protein
MIGTNDAGAARTKATVGATANGDSRQAAARAGISRRDFFDEVVGALRASIGDEHAAFRHRANPMMLKIDFGNDRIHYEVWPDSARNHIELGLHFEDGPVSTAAYLAYFDARIVEIKHQLGAGIELERWTVSWGHLYETIALTRLDRGFARQIAERLARLITTLQPLVEDAAVPAEPRVPAVPGGRRRWRSR